MKQKKVFMVVMTVITCFLCGCSIERVRAMDGVKPEYTVMKEEDYPEKVKELIGENKVKEFQMTYQDGGYLYLMKGYGEQKTGGYSIQIEDLSLWDHAIHLQTILLGPKDGEELKEEASYPCLVIKMKYREEPVIFE